MESIIGTLSVGVVFGGLVLIFSSRCLGASKPAPRAPRMEAAMPSYRISWAVPTPMVETVMEEAAAAT